MGLLDFFKQNDFSALQEQGGMHKKYQRLIKNIESLSKEDIYSYKYSGMRELNHIMNSSLTQQNEYTVTLLFQRERQISIDKDTFKLKHFKDTIEIEYTRESKNLIPILPDLLPPLVKKKIVFKNSENQDLIFINLLNTIHMMFIKDYNLR